MNATQMYIMQQNRPDTVRRMLSVGSLLVEDEAGWDTEQTDDHRVPPAAAAAAAAAVMTADEELSLAAVTTTVYCSTSPSLRLQSLTGQLVKEDDKKRHGEKVYYTKQ